MYIILMYKFILILVTIYLLYMAYRCNEVKEEFAVVGNITTAVKVITDAATELVDVNEMIVGGRNLNVNGPIKSKGTELYPVGSIIAYTGNTLPIGWLLCNGQVFDKVKFPLLNILIGSHFGGKTPNIMGRAIIGVGTGTGLTERKLGDNTGGVEKHALTIDEMPSHNHGGTTSTNGAHSHSYNIPSNETWYNGGGTPQYKGKYGATTGVYSHTHTVQTTGGANSNGGAEGNGDAHENMMPFVTIYYIIRAA
jgi:microcystin-dependent protein